MNLSQLRSIMIRHRATLVGLAGIFAATLAALYFAYTVDVFPNDDPTTIHRATVELDEALAIAGLTALALFIFAVRQYFSTRREIRARVEAERHATLRRNGRATSNCQWTSIQVNCAMRASKWSWTILVRDTRAFTICAISSSTRSR
jgi:hypothetical protein